MTGGMASIAKMNNAKRPASLLRGRDVLGGTAGLLDDYVARHLSDMEIVYTYEGTEHAIPNRGA